VTGDPPRQARAGRWQRALLLAAGSVSLALGVVGVVVPVLPTTPFLIVAAYCYARSSTRCYRWLVGNRVFGRYLSDYLGGRGVSWKVKAATLILLWVVITLSAVFFTQQLWVRALLFSVAAGVTVHVATLRGRKREGTRHP
jgi:uncharacterized membrane protein YbaN (DUF454 family)